MKKSIWVITVSSVLMQKNKEIDMEMKEFFENVGEQFVRVVTQQVMVNCQQQMVEYAKAAVIEAQKDVKEDFAESVGGILQNAVWFSEMVAKCVKEEQPDIDDEIDKAVRNYDFTRDIESAVDDYDIDDKVKTAVENLTFEVTVS